MSVSHVELNVRVRFAIAFAESVVFRSLVEQKRRMQQVSLKIPQTDPEGQKHQGYSHCINSAAESRKSPRFCTHSRFILDHQFRAEVSPLSHLLPLLPRNSHRKRGIDVLHCSSSIGIDIIHLNGAHRLDMISNTTKNWQSCLRARVSFKNSLLFQLLQFCRGNLFNRI